MKFSCGISREIVVDFGWEKSRKTKIEEKEQKCYIPLESLKFYRKIMTQKRENI